MLYFVRHGQSEANVLNEFSNRGFKHPLTPKGIDQSERLAAELQGIPFKKVFSSPILRAIQTASILTGRLGIPSFEVHEALREHDVGELEGRSDEESWNRFFEMHAAWERPENRDRRYHGGESYAETVRRFTRFVRGVAESADGAGRADADFLFVGHGGLYIAAMPALAGNLTYDFTRTHPIDNADVILVERDGGTFRCLRWGAAAVPADARSAGEGHADGGSAQERPR